MKQDCTFRIRPSFRAPEGKRGKQAFTLIELSIVLVIIGLIVGGVLMGQDLIRAAAARAQISQIEKYNTAANTFHAKYGYLPGDIKDPDASNFGFQARGQYEGEGDGNGFLEGVTSDCAGCNSGAALGTGESVMFWADLSKAGLIEGGFSTASPNTPPGGTITPSSSPSLDAYFPEAKLGNGQYVYVYSGGIWSPGWIHSGINYFGLSGVTSLSAASLNSVPALTTQQAYSIDKKIDDGMPQTGNVTAEYAYSLSVVWAEGGGGVGAGNYGAFTMATNGPTNSATPSSAITCYDNGGGTGSQQYSLEVNNGIAPNCTLSFRFQ